MDVSKLLKEYNETLVASLIRAGISEGMTVDGLTGVVGMCQQLFVLQNDVENLKVEAAVSQLEITELEDDLISGGYDCVCGANSRGD